MSSKFWQLSVLVASMVLVVGVASYLNPIQYLRVSASTGIPVFPAGWAIERSIEEVRNGDLSDCPNFPSFAYESSFGETICHIPDGSMAVF